MRWAKNYNFRIYRLVLRALHKNLLGRTKTTTTTAGINDTDIPENAEPVAGQRLLVRLDLGLQLRGHGHHALAELHLGAAVDDALGGALHHHQPLSVGLVLLLHYVHLVAVWRGEERRGEDGTASGDDDDAMSGTVGEQIMTAKKTIAWGHRKPSTIARQKPRQR